LFSIIVSRPQVCHLPRHNPCWCSRLHVCMSNWPFQCGCTTCPITTYESLIRRFKQRHSTIVPTRLPIRFQVVVTEQHFCQPTCPVSIVLQSSNCKYTHHPEPLLCIHILFLPPTIQTAAIWFSQSPNRTWSRWFVSWGQLVCL
jgi:hypothetical protein